MGDSADLRVQDYENRLASAEQALRLEKSLRTSASEELDRVRAETESVQARATVLSIQEQEFNTQKKKHASNVQEAENAHRQEVHPNHPNHPNHP